MAKGVNAPDHPDFEQISERALAEARNTVRKRTAASELAKATAARDAAAKRAAEQKAVRATLSRKPWI